MNWRNPIGTYNLLENGAVVVVKWIERTTRVCAIWVWFHLVENRKINEKEAGDGPYLKDLLENCIRQTHSKFSSCNSVTTMKKKLNFKKKKIVCLNQQRPLPWLKADDLTFVTNTLKVKTQVSESWLPHNLTSRTTSLHKYWKWLNEKFKLFTWHMPQQRRLDCESSVALIAFVNSWRKKITRSVPCFFLKQS